MQREFQNTPRGSLLLFFQIRVRLVIVAFHPIPAILFRLVHGCIGAGYELFGGLDIDTDSRNTEAHGDCNFRIVERESLSFDGFSHLFRCDPGVFGARLREDYNELLAAKAGDDVRLPQTRDNFEVAHPPSEHDSQLSEYFISGLMSVVVVYQFEMIDVAEND